MTNANESNNYEELQDPSGVSSQEYQGLYHLPDYTNVNGANNYEELRDKNNGDYMNIKQKVKWMLSNLALIKIKNCQS